MANFTSYNKSTKHSARNFPNTVTRPASVFRQCFAYFPASTDKTQTFRLKLFKCGDTIKYYSIKLVFKLHILRTNKIVLFTMTKLIVTEECQRIEYHEQSVLQVTYGMDRNRPKDNKAAASDVKAYSGDVLVSVDSIMDQKVDALLKENFSDANTPSQKVSGQRSHSIKRFFSGKGKVSEYKLDEDEFIDDFDLLLDEVEEDIRIEETLSSPKSNPHSSKSKNVFEEIEDQSIIDVETRDE